MQSKLNIALVGNPNSGKSSLFNILTGLNQKVGNFPGVTVDKKTGTSLLAEGRPAKIIDLPGTYSLYPKSSDEFVTYDLLLNPFNEDRPNLVVIIADASNLKRNLLFCSQIIDMKIPVVIALTMMDLAKKRGVDIDINRLELELGVPVLHINPRKNKGIQALKKTMLQTADGKYQPPAYDFIPVHDLAPELIESVRHFVDVSSDYAALHIASQVEELAFLQPAERMAVQRSIKDNRFNKTQVQGKEILARYAKIKQIMTVAVHEADPKYRNQVSERIDNVLLHRFWGYFIMLAVLFVIFQSIFSFAQYPMDAIQQGFSLFSGFLASHMPDNAFSDLIINGIVAGMSGIAVFIPQIMILFGLITILEDTGYMARISFLTDRLMRQVGLNGKSVMPLISGVACAVPAIMATRSIENKKERLITILVTPLMSCSARLPVYTILIALVIPAKTLFGFFNLQGLVMMGLYLLGFFTAILVSSILRLLIKMKEKSYFIMELPLYRAPRWKNVGVTMVEKAKIFVTDAGKVIMIISLVLWYLASYGPPKEDRAIRQQYRASLLAHPGQKPALETAFKSDLLQHSFAGYLGRAIEPAIRPLGFDWKIGIALITSFAAREVFVGTMATLYSVGQDPENNTKTLQEKMSEARRSDGTKVYTLATGISLLLFYVFAMQCMSTLAIVRRETKSWKYPLFQLFYMTGIAYLSSFLAFWILS